MRLKLVPTAPRVRPLRVVVAVVLLLMMGAVARLVGTRGFFFVQPLVGVPLIVAHLVSARARGVVRFALFALTPVAVLGLGIFARDFIWDPNAGCDYECWDTVGYYVIPGALLVLGVWIGTTSGGIAAVLRRRERARAAGP